MVFSDTTNKNGIIQRIEDACNLGDAGITGNSTLFLKITGYVNDYMKKVASALMEVDKMWKFDDYNYTDFPRGTATLVAGRRDYTLPAATTGGNAATLLGVIKVAVLDTNSTAQERTLQLTNLDEADLNNMYPSATPGLPFLYKLVSNSIKMWPIPSSTYCTMTSGLVVYFKRTPKPFDTTTTDAVEPGFVSTWHDILIYGAAATYLLPKNPKLAGAYFQLVNDHIDKLQDDFANMNDDVKNRIMPVRRSSR